MAHPTTGAPGSQPDDRPERRSELKHEPPVFPLLKDANILIVDDTPVNLALLGAILRKAGCRITSAASGPQALSLAATHRPELILLDIMMPGMDGFEVCRQLQEKHETRATPVIFISALHEVEEKVRAFQSGGVDYITKPFQADEVLARVSNHIRILRLQRELEREKAETERVNQALFRSQRQADTVFSALSDHLEGRVLDGKYQLRRKLGQGGFGVVYQATHILLQREVAVKILRPAGNADPDESLRRFQVEGMSACRVNHPNAVAILDSGIAHGVPFLVMELLVGRTLGHYLESNPRVHICRVLEIAVPVCRVLIAAHEVGLAHRDIKPDNIFLHDPGDGEFVKVLDFGIAKLLGGDAISAQAPRRTHAGLVGTPVYMAPERLRGREHDGRSDVYSLGVVMYEMLTGHAPFGDEKEGYVQVLFRRLSEDPMPLTEYRKDLSKSTIDLIMAALRRDPATRPTASEFLKLLLDTAVQEKCVIRESRPSALMGARNSSDQIPHLQGDPQSYVYQPTEQFLPAGRDLKSPSDSPSMTLSSILLDIDKNSTTG